MMSKRSRSSKLKRRSKRLDLVVGSLTLFSSLTHPALAQAGKMVKLAIPVPNVIQRSQLVGHKTSSDTIYVNVSLLPANPAGLQAFADSVSNPSSPNYRKFASSAQLGQMFGQPITTIQKVVNYLKEKGLKVTLVADNRMNILANGSVVQVESAFNTTINNYRLINPSNVERSEFFSYSEPLHVPAGISSVISAVSGLDNIVKPVPLRRSGVKIESSLNLVSPKSQGN
jgi:subtilase family serine protease